MKVRVLKIELPTYDGETDDKRDVYFAFEGSGRMSVTMWASDVYAHQLTVGSYYDVKFEPTDAPARTETRQ